ncbi:cache domain-containing sensor histidine kinase [Kineothrix sp. MB12-C1]|uniref:cache domain-containing sensor histidine kinase n=1 Tax=Kineothrix sp. MB12-C1 TaxID=3070215 RepID=UPI0027D24D5B|nr:sensor histidine kinase [Kineothrix sp. MB12-C1]WMC93250.1 sensor histidine kinase [Kineothrix sp. MB12-C1]
MISILKKFRDFNIRTKLIIGFSFILLLLVLILVVAFYTYSAKIILKHSLEQTRETVEQFSNSLDSYMTLMSNKMEVLADSPTIQEELNTPPNEANIESDSFYSRNKQIRRIMLQAYSSITMNDMELYGANGTSYYLSLWSDKHEIPNEDILFAKADLAKGKWVLINDQNDEDTLQIIKLVKDLQTYKPIGYIRIGLKRSYIEKMTSNISFGNDGSIAILDANMERISGVVGESLITKMSGETSSQGNFLYEEGSSECTVVYTHSNITGWDTVGFIPLEYIKKDLAGIRNLAVVLIVFAIIIGISVSIAIAQSLVSSLENTANALERFAQGDFEVRLCENRADEIGKMNRVFNKAIKDINELMQKVTQGEILNKEMEFKTLQSQMNPHFLYNTLDTINWMAFKEKQIEICNLVTAISNLIRASISNKQSIITLEQELNYVKDYLYIQHVRYKDRFDTIYDIDDSLLNQTVPKLIVQPIVENAIIHGIENTQSKNFLYISVKRENESIDIIVKDTGIGMSEEKISELLKEPITAETGESEVHTNLGLYAVHKRLKFMYGDSYGLIIRSKEGEGTTVILHIPYIQEPQKLYKQFNDLLRN